MIEAVIFDLDGVLVSTDELHYEAWKALADHLGIKGFSKRDNERQRGVSRMASLEIVLEKSHVNYTEDEKLSFATLKNNLYVESLEAIDETAALAGVKEVLEYLKERGVKIALGSASKNADLIVEKVGLVRYFDAIASGNDTSKSKPDPQVFLVAAKKLGVDPSRCLVVEDAYAGVEAALAGGMKVLAVGGARNHPGATYLAEDLADRRLNWSEIL